MGKVHPGYICTSLPYLPKYRTMVRIACWHIPGEGSKNIKNKVSRMVVDSWSVGACASELPRLPSLPKRNLAVKGILIDLISTLMVCWDHMPCPRIFFFFPRRGPDQTGQPEGWPTRRQVGGT